MEKEKIKKEDALKVWNNPKTKILFEANFGSFENYWKECEEFNNATSEEQEKIIKSATEKLEEFKKNEKIERIVYGVIDKNGELIVDRTSFYENKDYAISVAQQMNESITEKKKPYKVKKMYLVS